MCVAVPGKIIEREGDVAIVEVSGNRMKVNVALIPAGIGDYVLIHAGVALEVLKEDQAQEMIDLFRELEEVMTE